ncbi:MAG: methyltransferase domain-containing protein [Betaproteobacteria bacterium]|nr:methyltransferase domain-containing protein [Betaproteobacteria bacterium]
MTLLVRAQQGLRPRGSGTCSARRHRHSFVCADAESLPLAVRTVDSLFSNLAMQWLDRTRSPKRSRALKPGGLLLLFTTFGPDTLSSSAPRSPGGGRPGPHVNGFVDMTIGDALVHAGLADRVMD